MLKAEKVMNKSMKLLAGLLLLSILCGYPLRGAVSEETVKPEGENTIGDGYKAIKEAEGRIEAPSDKQAQSSSQAENDSETKPGNEDQGKKVEAQPQGPTKANVKERLPRGDSLRRAEKPRYDSTGLRDPFEPFIKLVDTPSGPPPVVRPPIQRYPLNRFRLAGIIWIGDEAKAMIVDPETNTYFLGVGDKIGNKDGEIVEVRERGILVQERTSFENIYGDVKVEVKRSVLAFQSEE